MHRGPYSGTKDEDQDGEVDDNGGIGAEASGGITERFRDELRRAAFFDMVSHYGRMDVFKMRVMELKEASVRCLLEKRWLVERLGANHTDLFKLEDKMALVEVEHARAEVLLEVRKVAQEAHYRAEDDLAESKKEKRAAGLEADTTKEIESSSEANFTDAEQKLRQALLWRKWARTTQGEQKILDDAADRLKADATAMMDEAIVRPRVLQYRQRGTPVSTRFGWGVVTYYREAVEGSEEKKERGIRRAHRGGGGCRTRTTRTRCTGGRARAGKAARGKRTGIRTPPL